ncbi:MAG TPA: hypothetical protein VK363_13380 [Pyrinomonadaceae bacterium]|nr:hypothetical protein [Pyrinomonadaceae bacterium]
MHIFRRRAARKYLKAMLVSLALVVSLAAPASAQLNQWGYWENGVTESWWFSSDDFTKEDAVAAVERWKSAGLAAQDAAGAEWSGIYFSGGDTHGTYARWSPHGGFIIAHIDKCQARVMGLTYGRVEASPTLVQFFPEFSKTSRHTHGHSRSRGSAKATLRFVPVTWRGQRLLVREDEMGDFGDYAVGLGKYNYSQNFFYLGYVAFLTRHVVAEGSPQIETQETLTGGKTDAAASAPVVPSNYARFLKKPVEGTITAVGKRQVRKNYSYESPDGSSAVHTRASLTFVTVNVGTAHGVKAGMFLRVAEPKEGEQVRIIRADKHSSNGVVIRDLGDSNDETFFDGEADQPRRHSKVAAGWKLTTLPLF